jgi:hypothetical protein
MSETADSASNWKAVLAHLELWNSIPDHKMLELVFPQLKNALIGTEDHVSLHIFGSYSGRGDDVGYETTAGKLREALKNCIRNRHSWDFILSGSEKYFSECSTDYWVNVRDLDYQI